MGFDSITGFFSQPTACVIFLEAVRQEFWIDCPWGLLHADNHVIVVETKGEIKNYFSF